MLVPPMRGIWMPAGIEYWIRTIGEVQMRTVYIRSDAVSGLPLHWATGMQGNQIVHFLAKIWNYSTTRWRGRPI
jgi:hypothetical protein